MARKDDLYNEIYNYCEENACWSNWNTAQEWNEVLGSNYGIPSFTALVDTNKLERGKGARARAYEYRLIPDEHAKELMDAYQKEQKRKNAEYTIAHYEESLSLCEERYKEMIKQAEEQYKRDIAFQKEKFDAAQAVMAQYL